MTRDYCFSIEDGSRVRGGAFLVTRKYALTATHCLPCGFSSSGDSRSPTQVKLVSEGGVVILARVSECSGDIALLEVLAFRQHSILAPVIGADAVRTGRPWEAPYRPTLQHPTLTGEIGNADLPYKCADGTVLSVIQLRVSEEIGDHSGYSGGPVISRESDQTSPAIIGLPIEQFPDQSDPTRAANVAFAARVEQIFRTFEAFRFADRLDLASESGPPRSAPMASVPREGSTGERLEESEQILERARRWADRDSIDELEYREIKALVRDLVFVRR